MVKSLVVPPLPPRSVHWVCRPRRSEKISQRLLVTGYVLLWTGLFPREGPETDSHGRKVSASPSASRSRTVKLPSPLFPLHLPSSSRR